MPSRLRDAPAAVTSVLAAAVITAAFVGGLLLFPTGDGSYRCGRPPAWLLAAPAREAPALRRDFFDEGFQCNHDARRRGMEALVALTVGGAAIGLLRARS